MSLFYLHMIMMSDAVCRGLTSATFLGFAADAEIAQNRFKH